MVAPHAVLAHAAHAVPPVAEAAMAVRTRPRLGACSRLCQPRLGSPCSRCRCCYRRRGRRAKVHGAAVPPVHTQSRGCAAVGRDGGGPRPTAAVVSGTFAAVKSTPAGAQDTPAAAQSTRAHFAGSLLRPLGGRPAEGGSTLEPLGGRPQVGELTPRPLAGEAMAKPAAGACGFGARPCRGGAAPRCASALLSGLPAAQVVHAANAARRTAGGLQTAAVQRRREMRAGLASHAAMPVQRRAEQPRRRARQLRSLHPLHRRKRQSRCRHRPQALHCRRRRACRRGRCCCCWGCWGWQPGSSAGGQLRRHAQRHGRRSRSRRHCGSQDWRSRGNAADAAAAAGAGAVLAANAAAAAAAATAVAAAATPAAEGPAIVAAAAAPVAEGPATVVACAAFYAAGCGRARSWPP
eukprot:365260-Chlamydomonas_euryale.AAC.4